MSKLTSHRRLISAALAALVLASVATTASPAAGRARRPSLALTRGSPMTVRGRNFTPGRRVAVTVTMSRRLTRAVTPGAGGGFTVSFPATMDRCGPWSVTAVQGARRVLLRSGARPMCAPAGTA